MSLNSHAFSAATAPCAAAPCAKLTPFMMARPSPKSFATPVQPATSPISRSSLYWNTPTTNTGLIRPM